MLTLSTLLSGCMSTLEALNPLVSKPAEPVKPLMYDGSKDQWQRAAFRPNDIFNRYELKIFASVKWKKRTDASSYRFENIQIGGDSDSYTFNLLHPQFSGKMACGWYCEYIDQPITRPVIGPYTMLDKIYEGQQSELLNFYDSLKRLNDRLLSVDPDYLHLMPSIIDRLATTPMGFESLAHVVGYLNDYFDDIDFAAEFERLPAVDGVITADAQDTAQLPENQVQAAEQDDSDSTITVDTLTQTPAIAETAIDSQPFDYGERNESSQFLDTPNPDSALLASFEAAPLMPYMLQSEPPPAPQYTPPPAPVAVSDPAKSTTDNSLWSTLNQREINIGQFVCSYQDNYFGEVAAINGQTVNVALKGQAKSLKDGLFVAAEPGVLFLTDADFSYLQSEDSKTFTQHQLAPCFLSGF